MFKTLSLSLVALIASTSITWSHEFWIDPVEFKLAEGEPIIADIRVGEKFKGSPYGYIPDNFRLFELAQGDVRTPVEGRLGDRPALTQAAIASGLSVILHVTRDYTVTWTTWEKFVGFVEHKDFDGILEQHRANGFPESDFVEAYSRYAKSLVAVGDGAGQDRDYGLATEIVALANPYTDDLTDGMPVRVTYDGAPRIDTQVEVFAKDADDSVTVTTIRTDDKGVAVVPVSAGLTYLVDAVVIRPPTGLQKATTGAVWETLWASLTFSMPPD